MFFRLSSDFPQTVEQYLLPHEKRHVTVHRHPAVFAVHFGILAVACAAASLLTIMTSSSGLVLGIAWGVFFIIFLWLNIRVAAWSRSYFVVTDSRFIFITGLIAHKVITVPIIEIDDFMHHRSQWGRILGYGTFTADQATGDYKIPKMNFMPYPEQIFLEICKYLLPDNAQNSQEYDSDDSP